VSEQALDALLQTTREPEPFDDAFVRSVMQKVRNFDNGAVVRFSRPVITAVAAAALLAGSAAADLGPRTDPSSPFVSTAIVEVYDPPPLPTLASADPVPAGEDPDRSSGEAEVASEEAEAEPEPGEALAPEPTAEPILDVYECASGGGEVLRSLEFCYWVHVEAD
jgi:hypothetical protein